MPLRVAVCLVLAILAHAGVAAAAEPACFPERTVLSTTELLDAWGRAIGTLRGGQRVNVIADQVGAKGSRAEISIAEPVPLRGFVDRQALRVFLRQDFPIEPDRTWWTAGAPMLLFSGDARRGEVTRDDAQADAPRLTMRCALLTGSVAADGVVDDECHCHVLSGDRAPAGTPVSWEERHHLHVEMGKGYEPAEVEDLLGGGLIERKGAQALIEVLDPWRHLRVRRWVSADGMKTGESGKTYGVGSLCVQGDQPLGQHGAKLKRSVPIRAEEGASEPFTVLPAGTEYRVLRVGAAEAQIVARWPGWALRRYRVDVRGWVPVAMLPAPPDARPSGNAVVGRVVLSPGVDPKRLSTLVVLTGDGQEEPLTFRAEVQADGRFSVPVEPMGPPTREAEGWSNVGFYRVEVTSPSGDLGGVEEEAPAMPGGADEVVITVGPTVEIVGRVESRTGALVPDAPVKLLEPIANATTRTGPDGRFRFRVPPGEYTVEGGEDSFADVDTRVPGGEIVVRRRRRPAIFGSVGRRSDGRCLATRVNTATPSSSARKPDHLRSFPIDDFCRYTADDLPREGNSTTLTLDIPSSPALSRSTYPADPEAEPACFEGKCPPGVPDASVFVEVADARGVQVGDGPVVARVAGVVAGACLIQQGHCYIHHLAPGLDVRLSSKTGPLPARADLHLSPGVNEVLLRTPQTGADAALRKP